MPDWGGGTSIGVVGQDSPQSPENTSLCFFLPGQTLKLDDNILLLEITHIMIARNWGNYVELSCWLAFKISESAIQASRGDKASIVLLRNELCKLQHNPVRQNVLTCVVWTTIIGVTSYSWLRYKPCSTEGSYAWYYKPVLHTSTPIDQLVACLSSEEVLTGDGRYHGDPQLDNVHRVRDSGDLSSNGHGSINHSEAVGKRRQRL